MVGNPKSQEAYNTNMKKNLNNSILPSINIKQTEINILMNNSITNNGKSDSVNSRKYAISSKGKDHLS